MDLVAKAEADLEQAQARVAKARADLAKAEADATQLTTIVSWLRRQTGASDAEDSGGRKRIALAGTKSGDLLAVAIEAIRKAGRALSIAELETATVVAGLEIGGANPRANLAGYLSRDPRVGFQHGRGWFIVENEDPAEAGSENVGSVAERSIAPDSKSGGEGPEKSAPVGSNPTASAPIHRVKDDLLAGTSVQGAWPTRNPLARR